MYDDVWGAADAGGCGAESITQEDAAWVFHPTEKQPLLLLRTIHLIYPRHQFKGNSQG